MKNTPFLLPKILFIVGLFSIPREGWCAGKGAALLRESNASLMPTTVSTSSQELKWGFFFVFKTDAEALAAPLLVHFKQSG